MDDIGADLLTHAGDGVTVVGRLTDADLVALCGSDADRLAPLPLVRTYDDAGRAVAASTAARSIEVHGLDVEAVGGLTVEQTLAGLLALRRDPLAVVQGEQQVATDDAFVVAYFQDANRCLLEEVSRHGVHRFVLATSEQVVADLTSWCLPDLGDGVDGEPEDVHDDDFAAIATGRLAACERVTVLVGTRPRPDADPQRRVTVYELPDACVLVMRVDPVTVRVVSASRRTAHGVIASLVTA